MILFIDTAATGMWRFKDNPHAPIQPHLIRVACLLEADNGSIAEDYCAMVRPVPD